LLQSACPDTGFCQAAILCIAEKNEHDLLRLCRQWNVAPADQQRLCCFLGLYGDPKSVLQQLRSLCAGLAADALAELTQISALLEETPYASRIHLDFSVVNNMSYYDGIVFTGFLSGISGGILAGGQYGKLMRKLGCSANAIGFALYLDLLEQLPSPGQGYDVDVLLVYDSAVDPGVVARKVAELTAAGKTVSAQRSIPQKLRYRQLIRLDKEDVSC
jgi:ATP phosphoribosyltransferase regulatory subunit